MAFGERIAPFQVIGGELAVVCIIVINHQAGGRRIGWRDTITAAASMPPNRIAPMRIHHREAIR